MPRTPDRAAVGAAWFGFATGAAWSIALTMAQQTPIPWWLRGPLFVALAVITIRWAGGWRA